MLINNVTDFTKHISCLGLFEVNNAALIITLPDDTTVTVRTLDGHEGECNLVITLDSKILLNSDVTYEIVLGERECLSANSDVVVTWGTKSRGSS